MASDRVKIKERSTFEWVPIFLENLSATPNVYFGYHEIRALRSTCKAIKHLVDPRFKRLEVDLKKLGDDEYPGLASSSLIHHIRELHIVRRGSYDLKYMQSFLLRCGPAISSILRICAPRLEVLEISITENDNTCFLSRAFLTAMYQYPRLKALVVRHTCPGFIAETLRPALPLMPLMERLLLGTDHRHGKGGVCPADLRALTEVALENLNELTLSVETDRNGSLVNEEDEYVNPLMTILQMAKNLKKCTLSGAPNTLRFFENVQLKQLQEFNLDNSNIDRGFALPSPAILESLNISNCAFTRSDSTGLHAVLTSGNLLKLKELELDEVHLEDDLASIISNLRLPSLESITFSNCSNFSTNDIFRIAEAGPGLPNLKSYRVLKPILGEIEYDYPLAITFLRSPLCAGLEAMYIDGIVFTGRLLQELVVNASNMKNLKELTITLKERDDGLQIANAGMSGGFPNLKLLVMSNPNIGWRLDPLPVDALWCKLVFNPIWPNLYAVYY
jgi:hypothetical protein